MVGPAELLTAVQRHGELYTSICVDNQALRGYRDALRRQLEAAEKMAAEEKKKLEAQRVEPEPIDVHRKEGDKPAIKPANGTSNAANRQKPKPKAVVGTV